MSHTFLVKLDPNVFGSFLQVCTRFSVLTRLQGRSIQRIWLATFIANLLSLLLETSKIKQLGGGNNIYTVYQESDKTEAINLFCGIGGGTVHVPLCK